MKKLKLFASVWIAGLLMFFMIKLGGAQTPTSASDLARPSTTNTVVTHTFSYQGMLEEDGQPVNGDYVMAFSLYANDTCTMPVGTTLTYTVPISHGVFSVDLGFRAQHFNGQALWLETQLEGTELGCQPIQAVPYALGLRPGAIISGSVNAEGNLMHVRSEENGMNEGVLGAKFAYRTGLGYPVGLYAYAYEYGSVGVWGASDSEFGWGVNGIAFGPDSIGVRGVAKAFGSTTYGVYGEANAANGYGGYFLNTIPSGNGLALAAEGHQGAAITSTGGTALWASGAGDGSFGDDGVRGIHTGDGVVGESQGTENLDNGVIGFAAEGYGVYGFSNGAGQYGGYFDDPIFVNGGCTGCTLRYIARNHSTHTLKLGDVVQPAGIDAATADTQMPVMQVTPTENGGRVLGVVVGRTDVTMVAPGDEDAQPGPHYGPVGGIAQPGDYVIIVVQGMAQVRVAPTADIRPGAMLGVGPAGVSQADDGPTFGMVLDTVDNEGLAWVFVGFD